jgi:hypothetical protein
LPASPSSFASSAGCCMSQLSYFAITSSRVPSLPMTNGFPQMLAFRHRRCSRLDRGVPSCSARSVGSRLCCSFQPPHHITPISDAAGMTCLARLNPRGGRTGATRRRSRAWRGPHRSGRRAAPEAGLNRREGRHHERCIRSPAARWCLS